MMLLVCGLLSLNSNWRMCFMHIYNYFEYVLGDHGYQGMDQYIVCRLGHHKVPKNDDNNAINAFNKRHACFRLR